MARFLIVEDEMVTALSLKYFLCSKGYKVIKIVSTGKAAVETAISEKPDIVLMDINLKGGINGLQAAEEIVAFNIPVIFITAQSDEPTVRQMQKLSSYYIFKPFQEFLLTRDISSILDNTN